MGITGAVSGSQAPHQQAIDASTGIQQPSSSQSSTEARGVTGTRTVSKADSSTVVISETEPIREHEFQSGSQTIHQRDVSKTGCKEAWFGKGTDEIVEMICGIGCLVSVGVTLISLTGVGYLGSPNKTTLPVNDTQGISTPSLDLTHIENMTKVLQDVLSAASVQDNDDSSGAGGLYGVGVLFIALAVALVLGKRFCQSSDSQKAGKGPGSEKQNSEAIDLESCSQKSGSAYEGRHTSSFASGSEARFRFEHESFTEPGSSHKKKEAGCSFVKMPTIYEVAEESSGLCFSTKYPVRTECAPADDSEEDESSSLLPFSVTVDVEAMPPDLAQECSVSAKEGRASTQLMEGESTDETALTPFEGSDVERLYHFIEKNAFDFLEPDQRGILMRNLSKVSEVDFKSFAKDVVARDEGRVRQSISEIVTGKFPDLSPEHREQLVQKFTEVINTFPDSPPVAVVTKDTVG